MFDLRLQAALIDAAWSSGRPGLMLLLIEDMASTLKRLRIFSSRAAARRQVMPEDGLMTGAEVALLAGVHVRTVGRQIPHRALRPTSRGGKPAYLYAVDDVIPWLLARAEGRPLPAGLPG